MSTTPAMSDKERYHRYLCSREWGLLRDQVRRRCKGICERCNRAPMSHVHHLTYIRKYEERLEDLQGLCEPCHLFIHGKSHNDPMSSGPAMLMGEEIKSVYLAGRISGGHGDWRRQIVPGWQVGGGVTRWCEKERSGKYAVGGVDDAICPEGISSESYEWAALVPDGRAIPYTGPFWRDLWGGHGGGLGPHAFADEFPNDFGGHGPDDNVISDPLLVCRLCRECIRRADLVFAWLDSRNCHGTLLEIGWATEANKIVAVAIPRWDRELWLACASADRFIMAESAGKAWEWLWTHPTMTHRLGAVRDSHGPAEADDL